MAKKAKSGGKICPEGKAWAKRTFDTYPSAYANMAASKYCKDPNYAKGSKKKKRVKKAGGGLVFNVRGQGRVIVQMLTSVRVNPISIRGYLHFMTYSLRFQPMPR